MFSRTPAALVTLFLLIFSATTQIGHAVPPWSALVPFRRVEADPEKQYLLSESDGPWLIMAASFAGDGAERDAWDLVQELRGDFKLPAYIHRKRFDFSQPVEGLGLNRYGERKLMRYRQQGAYDEWAVLIGDFDAVDNPAIEKTLKKMKYARPESLQLQTGEGRETTQRFAGLRAIYRRMNSDESKRNKGPMGNAFVTRNPLLPKEFFAPEGIDKFVWAINKKVKHSLLNCPGKFTVRVATFRGNVVIDQRRIKEINDGDGMVSRLAAAAAKAHRVTEALRAKGVEAYEFHDRHDSIVTIGSFNSIGQPMENGRTEINPAIHQIMVTYGGQQEQIPGAAVTGVSPARVDGITLDVQPIPVEVPRYSLGSDYAHSLGG